MGPSYGQFAEPLRAIGDLERILARIALRSARPRDLAQLRAALAALPALKQALATVANRRCCLNWPQRSAITSQSMHC